MRPLIGLAILITVTPLVIWVASARILSESLPDPGGPKDLTTLSESELQTEKVRQEVLELSFKNRLGQSFWGFLSSNSAAVSATFTGGAAVAGIILTVWRQVDQRRKEAQERLDQQERDRRERTVESARRLEDRFASTLVDLGSEKHAIQAAAAISLLSFLNEELSQFHEQVFLVLQANLKLPRHTTVNSLLIRGFEQAIRLYLDKVRKRGQSELLLDLAHVDAERVDLSGIANLAPVDLAFATLKHSDLSEANLFRALGYRVDLDGARLTRANLEEARFQRASCRSTRFHAARLVSADLRHADLEGAQFHQAQLQAAHLERSTLRGAQFLQADVNDTYFIGANFDEAAIRSMLRASNWRKAHFDENIRERLELAARGPRGPA